MALTRTTSRRLIQRKPRETTLRPVRPNAGLEAEFRRKLTKLVAEMHESVVYWTTATYRGNEPEVTQLGQDESPAAALRAIMRKLASRWLRNFEEAAPKLAQWFATAVKDRSDATLRKILKDGGFSIEWKMTPAMNDAMQATIGEQVSLIKSIPSQYFTQIEGMVMRSVTTGRAVGDLAKDLEKAFGVTTRRARFIALDQSNKASATLTRVRQLESVGADAEAIWVHSAGGKVPRPSHVKAGREKTRYRVSEGWYDPDEGEKILPGQLINCRCCSRLVIPALDKMRKAQ